MYWIFCDLGNFSGTGQIGLSRHPLIVTDVVFVSSQTKNFYAQLCVSQINQIKVAHSKLAQLEVQIKS